MPFHFGEGTWYLNNTGIYLKLMKSWNLKYGVLLAREPERVADARKARRDGEKKEKNICIKIFKGQG